MVSIKNYDSDSENKWCPGCGNFAILTSMKEAFVKLNLAPHEILIFSGIGQAAKTPHFLKCNMFHGLHGRALPAATGAKTANHNLTILVNSGDGDCYGEGGNHFINAIRRNIDITLLVHNNKVYGLTKGQASPTSDMHMVTRAQPQGVILEPLNPLTVALALKGSFIARGFSGRTDHLSMLIREGIKHKGFSLIDILQPCVSFNHVNTFEWYNERVYELEKEGHRSSNYMDAISKAGEWGDHIPIGIFYKEDKPSFAERIPTLKESALIDRTYDPQKLKALLSQF